MTAVREIAAGRDPVRVYDLRPRAPGAPSILVLKLDHLGDFIIGAPALRRLREAFPRSRIRLVVGSWNREAAEALGVADEVAVYDWFAATGWRGAPEQAAERFAAAAGGPFDIALDLRVDEDTRLLLQQVDARVRAGVGLAGRFPFLNVALPPTERSNGDWSVDRREVARFGPDRFSSSLPERGPLRHAGPLRPGGGHVVYGPDARLPAGRLEVRFDLAVRSRLPVSRRTEVTVDIARDGREAGAHLRLSAAQLARLGDAGVALPFDNDDPSAAHEFRVHLGGQPSRGRLVFGGAAVFVAGGEPPPRLRASPLHVGEQLALLVQLLRDRTAELYPDPGPTAAGRSGEVVVAPFSNSDLRDWPAASYARLVGLLVRDAGRRVALIGAARQAEDLERLKAASGGGEAVLNLGGRTGWTELPDRLRHADLVICNNSGVAHAAAAAGARVLALYSASHPPTEWGPRGPRAEALMTAVSCSPCGFDIRAECPFDVRCLSQLTPELVFAEALRRLREDD